MKSNRSRSIAMLAALLAALRIVAGCGSAGGGQVVQQAISVTIAPSGAQSIDPGQTKQFTANVSNDSSNKGVSWTLTQSGAACSPGCGNISPASTGSGQPTTYSAPAAVNANVQFDVTATAVADGTKSATDVTTAVPPPVLNNPAQLPAATVGQSYSYTLTEAGGVAPVTWSITSGSLPAGLSLSSSTGVISGTPSVASQAVSAAQKRGGELQPDVTPSGFTVQGCDSGNPPLCNAQPVSVLVNSAPPPPDFALSALPNSLTIAQGSSGMSAITITPSSGFSGAVNLMASGLSAGVMQSFSAIANNSSTLMLTASASAALGTVTVAITGTSGSLTHTTSISLTINAAKALPACSRGNNPITAQPAFVPASVTLSGSPKTSTVSVTAPSAVSYQWFVGAQPSITGSSPIAGATSASYTTPTLTAAFSGLFYTVQVNTATCSQMSNPAFLTVNENPSGNGPIQIPTVQQQKRFALTQSGGAQFLACSGSAIDGPPPSCSQGAPAIDWTIYLNGSPCQLGCGSVVPANSPGGANGATTTYVAPTGLPLAGETFTLVATRHDDPTEFATAEIVVTPCNIGEPMCGDFTFFPQGFDANGKPANTAGHFTATGLVNGSTMITHGGVIDLNDSDGIDAGALITSGSYTFDTDSNGNLLPNLNSLTGTLTLNIASSLTPVKSHAHRTYAFTAASFGLGTGKASLIEFEPAQTGTPPVSNPASGFQGSGSLWQVGSPGPYAFASPCTANPANTPPSKCN